jgi:hypothetical protein
MQGLIRTTIATVAALAAVSLVPTVASASQVMFDPGGIARYKSSGSENNAVVAKRSTSGKVMYFVDNNVVISMAGSGCTLLSQHKAKCVRGAGINGVTVGTGEALPGLLEGRRPNGRDGLRR